VPNFDDISQSTADFRSRKPDSRHIGILFPVRFSAMHSHRHVILHLPAKFCNDRTIVGGVMTSFRLFKMASLESEMYFRVHI